MKNLINKVRHHGKKVTIYLKSQPKWVVRCMFGIGAILGLALSLHAHPIGGTNAQSIADPIVYCQCQDGGGTLCNTNKKDSDVHHYTGNITYIDIEGNVFTEIGTITIQSGDSIITLLDRNLGASTNDIENIGSYGYTIPFSGNIDENTDESLLDPTVFGIEEIINSQEDIQLCPDGFHIPSYQEWESITNMLGNDGEYLSENLLLPNIGLWSSSPSDWCGPGPCGDNEQAISAFIPVSVDCPGYSDFGRTSRGNTNGEYGIRCFYDKNQEYHPFIVNLYSGQDIIDTLVIWAGNDVILPILDDLGNSIFNGWFTDFELTIPFDDSTPITENLDLYAKWSDTTPPTCTIEYSTTGPTNQNVIATLTCEEDDITVTNNDGHMEYTFENIGTFTFEFQDLAGNTGTELAAVTWIDKDIPSCDVAYSTTGATTGNVTATLTCEEEEDGDITVTNNSGNMEYTFENTGTFTFEFQDLAGNTGEKEATVTRIDKIKPTCNVTYSTTGATTGNVTATLTGCSEAITGTDTQHTFTGNGTYTFNFHDLAGNTGSTGAEVTWIISGNNIVYFDIEGNEFIWNDLTMCNPNKTGECITMMDRNLGATTNDASKTGSYGYKYQWGNNYGFKSGETSTNATNILVNRKDIYKNSGYYGTSFVTATFYYWSDNSVHNQLWGGGDDNTGSNWGYPVTNYTDRQGPCPEGYHVPSAGERSKIVERWILKSNTGLREKGFKDTVSSNGAFLNRISDHSGAYAFRTDFKIPLNYGQDGYLWTSTARTHPTSYHMNGYSIEPWNSFSSTNGLPVRCFKNSSETGNTFSIVFNDNIKPGEYTTFTVKAMKDGQVFRDYTGSISFILTNKSGGLVNKKNYTLSNSGRYTFELSDQGIKVFYSGLKINQTGTYTLEVNGLNDGFKGSVTFNVGSSHSSANFEYDTLKFNPNYSNEMNEAYQYARYYDITTKNTIKDADMYSGLNRIAMAKMLTNYAENVLGVNNYNTGRNCKFVDVSTSLDKDYDYGVTKACQLGIMGVNMPDNRFYPNGGVTRAEFATALSRLLYGTRDGVGQYYSTHLVKLYQEKIITNTDPTLRELRGYVMLMLKRAAE